MVQIDPFGSFAQGVSLRNNMNQQRANVQAAQGLASGNYAQALGALGGAGDVGGVVQVQNAQAANQERQLQQQKQQQAQQLQTTMQIIGTVKRARDSGQDVSQILPQYRDAFIAMGTDPQQLAQIEQQVAANPAFLDQIENIIGQQARQLEIVNYGSGRGAVVIDKTTGEQVNQFAPTAELMNVNGVVIDPTTRETVLDTRAPKYERVRNADGSEDIIAIDQPAPIRGSGGGNGSFESVIGPLLQREGGYVARDGSSGAPANYGINQRANPDVNVRDLTPQAATQLYRERYWNPVVEAGVPAEAREAVFDFAVNAGPQRAISAWRQSGGDINAFNQARLEHYRRQPDYAQFGRSWERRVAETTPGTVDTRGGARQIAQGRGGASTTVLTNEEKAALGLPQNSVYQRDQQGRITQVPGSGSRDANLNQTDQRRISAAVTSAESASSLANDARRFVELNRRAGTNPLVGAAGPVASLNPTYAEMRAIQSRMAPLMREAGSGAMSDKDVALFLRSIPSIGNPTETNVALSSVIQAGAQRAQDRAAFLEDYAQKNGNLLGAQEQWTRYVNANPLFEERNGNTQARANVPSWRDFQAGSGRQRSQTNAPGIPFNLAGPQLATRQRLIQQGATSRAAVGSTQNPRYVNPQQERQSLMNIRPGEWFVTPSGEMLRMPNPNPYRRR